MQAIKEAQARGLPPRRLLRREGTISAEAEDLVERIERAGIPVLTESEREMRRMSSGAAAPELVALIGPDPTQDLDHLMRGEGLVVWLVGLRYPGNVGFILRAAEVAGVAGVVLTNDWGGEQFSEALRVGMRADRFMPVLRAASEAVLAAARHAGRGLLGVETSGDRAPWQSDLRRRQVLVLGGETHGLPEALLAEVDATVRIPTPGFVPSYNVQAAASMLLGEWLRQNAPPDPQR